MATTINVLPVETLKAMSEDEIAKLAKGASTIEKDAKDGACAQRNAFVAIGKIVHAIALRLQALQAEKRIARTVTVQKYWETVTGNELSKIAIKCCDAVGLYMETGLVPEKSFDANPYQNLTLAVEIADAVGGDLTKPAMLSAATELSSPGKETTKKLKAILDTVKTRKPITAEKAQERIVEIIGDGHLDIVTACAGAAYAYLPSDETGQKSFEAARTAIGMFEKNSNITPETLASWRGTPAPAAPAPKGPETAEEIDEAISRLFDKLVALDPKVAALCAAGNMDSIAAEHPDAVEAAMAPAAEAAAK